MSVWEYALLFFSVLLGGGMAFRVQRHYPQVLRLILSFSGAYILGIAVLHLMPAVFHQEDEHIGIWVLIGFFIQLFLDHLSRGVEHGHIHAHRYATAGFGLQILTGLCLHSFIEGMPLAGYAHLHDLTTPESPAINHLLYGIVIHKAPAAFALVTLLIQSQFSRSFIVGSLLVFASMSPLGAFLTERLAFSDHTLILIMALVIGSFLHISTTILFEADDTSHHTISWKKWLIIMGGFGLALLTV